MENYLFIPTRSPPSTINGAFKADSNCDLKQINQIIKGAELRDLATWGHIYFTTSMLSYKVVMAEVLANSCIVTFFTLIFHKINREDWLRFNWK